MNIGALASQSGVTTKTIRYYESIGVLPEPSRTPNGYRSYDEPAVDVVRFIRDAQATGLTLAEITSILQMRSQGESTCKHVVDLLRAHLRELDDRIDALRNTQEQLAELTEQASQLDPSACADPHRCQTIAIRRGSPERPPPISRGPQPHQH